MIRRSFYILTAVVAMLFASCEKYDHAISDIEDRLDKIEGTSLTTIDQQIAAINGSIDDLKRVDGELKGYIDALQNTANDLQSKIDATNDALAALESDLEGQITASEQKVLNELNTVKTALEGQLATINNTIATLQAKDVELEQRYFDLEQYINDEIAYTEEWASFTFSTLEQYEATQTAISEINALIKSTQESITALEEKLNKKIADDIATAIAGVDADIAAKVTEITNGYTTAIANATDAITEAYTDAIKTAITASETSMKEWVNGVLADGYYNKAEIDGKITALQTKVAEGDAALQKEIDALKEALAKAESDLTAAYKKAIADAITENNGKITEQIAAAVETAQLNLQGQIDAIISEIEKINTRLDIIEADITSINQQIDAINGSINDLKRVDGELKGYIDALQNTANDLQSKIDDTNDALAALESDLKGQISVSEQKVLSELNTEKTALEGQLATINNTIATLTSQLTAIEGKIASLETAVAACATQEDVNNVKRELATVQSDMAAMKEAITALQGRMDTVEGEVDSLQTTVADLESRIKDLENNFANRIQSLKYIPQFSDGKIALSFNTRATELYLRISPASIAGLIDEEHITVLARETDNPSTRSLNAEFPLHITELSCDETTGIIHVKFAEDETLGTFSNKFWMGSNEAVVCVRISDGNNDVFSDMVPMISKDFIVDLGLPSGTLWAACNVGSTRSEGYGDYFAWGETSPKTTYTWDSYKWGTENNLTKYNSTDGKTTLEAEDDAATANMGADWSTPTDEQWGELISQCVWTWTTLNGVNGYNIVGSNGNSIFLPAAGNAERYQGTQGQYWSNILANISHLHASMLNFTSRENQIIIGSEQGQVRYRGLSVRAVKKQ